MSEKNENNENELEFKDVITEREILDNNKENTNEIIPDKIEICQAKTIIGTKEEELIQDFEKNESIIEKQILNENFENRFNFRKRQRLNPDSQEEMEKIYDKLMTKHPYVINPETKEKEKFDYVHSSTGYLSIGQDEINDDIDSLGLGVSIYFKILKLLMIVFTVICILNLPLYFIYAANNSSKKITSKDDALFKTTIGNLASIFKRCKPIDKNLLLKNGNHTFEINCGDYSFVEVERLGISPLDTQVDNQNSLNCVENSYGLKLKYNSQCDFNSASQDYLIATEANKTKNNEPGFAEEAKKQCYRGENNTNLNKTCTFSYNMTNINAKCGNLMNGLNKFWFSYRCEQKIFNIDSIGLKITRQNVSWMAIIIDILSMSVLIIALFLIPPSVVKRTQFYDESNVTISDFTIRLEHLNLDGKNLYDDLSDLLEHCINVAKVIIPDYRENEALIYDVNFPSLTANALDYIIEKNGVETTIFNLTCNIEKLNKSISESDSNNSNQDKNDLIQELTDLTKSLDKNQKKLIEIKEALINTADEDLANINEVYITFGRVSSKKMFRNAYNNVLFCQRCCRCLTNKYDHMYFKDKWLSINPYIDAPSDISWENIQYPEWKKSLKRLFGAFISILVIAIGFSVIIAAKTALAELNKNWNMNVNCNLMDFTDTNLVQKEYFDKDIATKHKTKTLCFCKNKLWTEGITKTEQFKFNNTIPAANNFTDTEQYICKNSSLTAKLISYDIAITGYSVVVPVLNFALDFILKSLSLFERYNSLTDKMSSDLAKVYTITLINGAFTVLLVTSFSSTVNEWYPNFFILTGDFSDFTPKWYSVVGVSILTSMYLNIPIGQIFNILPHLDACCKRACDGGCCNNGKKTKLLTKSAYNKMYVGPFFGIGARYAKILYTISVGLIYSSGMPLLYVFILLFLIVVYCLDKYQCLYFYQNPPHYNTKLSTLFTSIVMIIVLVHYLFGMLMYGNNLILTNDLSNKQLLEFITWMGSFFPVTDNSLGWELKQRLAKPHVFIIFWFTVLVILIIILKMIIWDPAFYAKLDLIDGEANELEDNCNIYNCLILKRILKNYNSKKLQLKSYLQYRDENPRLSNSVDFFKKYLIQSIVVDRTWIVRTIKLKNQNFELNPLDDAFDKKISEHIKYTDDDKDDEDKIGKEDGITDIEKIKGDFSYNLQFIPRFEEVAYYLYLDNNKIRGEIETIRRTSQMPQNDHSKGEHQEIEMNNV